MNFVSREAVIAILGRWTLGREAVTQAIEALPCFPAPNPTESGGKNVLGQTHDEFWDEVERADRAGELPR